jgi:hypothetical protein
VLDRAANFSYDWQEWAPCLFSAAHGAFDQLSPYSAEEGFTESISEPTNPAQAD